MIDTNSRSGRTELLWPEHTRQPVHLNGRDPVVAGEPRNVSFRLAASAASTLSLWLACEKGSDPNSRNGPKGASHYWGLTPFRHTQKLIGRRTSWTAPVWGRNAVICGSTVATFARRWMTRVPDSLASVATSEYHYPAREG